MDLRHTEEGAVEALIDEAAAWFALMRNPDVSADVRIGLADWLSLSDNHAESYRRVKRIWNEAPFLINRDIQATRPQKRPDFLTGYFAKTAAILFVVAATAIVFQFVRHSSSTVRKLPSADAFPVEEANYSTSKQIRSSLALPDGSIVVLGRGSAIHMRYAANERAVILTEGQALFEVAKHQPRPFHVYVGDRRVTATGTAFNVRLQDKNVEVTLMEGSVVVGEVHATPGQNQQPRRLKPGERLVAAPGGSPRISTSGFDNVVDWHTDRLIALNSPLSSVLQILNRFNGPQIIASDERIAGLRIDGTLRADDPAAAARAIAQIYHLELVQSAPRQILLTGQ